MKYNETQLEILNIIVKNNFVHIDCLESGVGASSLLKEIAINYSDCGYKVCYVVDRYPDLKYFKSKNEYIYQFTSSSFLEKSRGKAFDVIIFDDCIIDKIDFNRLLINLFANGKIISVYTGEKHPEMNNLLEKFIIQPKINVFKTQRKKLI